MTKSSRVRRCMYSADQVSEAQLVAMGPSYLRKYKQSINTLHML